MPARRRRHAVLAASVVLAALLAGCSDNPTATPATTPRGSSPTSSTVPAGSSTTTTTTEPAVQKPRFVDENGFDDHSVPRSATVAELMALTRSGVGGQAALKFTIPEFDRPADSADLARAHLMDGNFYDLHDEWYYYRLLNGQRVVGDDTEPVTDSTFDTVDEIYRWAAGQPAGALPLGLTYRRRAAVLVDVLRPRPAQRPAAFGVGSIVRFPDPIRPSPTTG